MPKILLQEPADYVDPGPIDFAADPRSDPRDWIPYYEIAEGSPSYTFTNGTIRAERTFLVEWKLRDLFVKAVLGYPYVMPVTDNRPPFASYIARKLPMQLTDIRAISTRVGDESEFPEDTNPSSFNAIETENVVKIGNPFLYATAIPRVEGVEATGYYKNGIADYTWAAITVQFESLPYKVVEDEDLIDLIEKRFQNLDVAAKAQTPPYGLPKSNKTQGWPGKNAIVDPKHAYEWYMLRYVTRNVKPSAEYISLPRGRYKFVAFNKPSADFAAAYLIASLEITYTWHQVPYIPEGARKHVGKVNKYLFDPFFADRFQVYLTNNPNKKFVGFNPGTLLFTNCDIRPYRMGSGAYVYDIIYRMKHLEPLEGRGHNYFLRYDSGIMGPQPNNAPFRTHYLKITDTGVEDEIGDPFRMYLPPPYNTVQEEIEPQTDPDTKGKAPSAGKPVFQYADFRELFTANVSE